jgi:hypothetical protein
MWGILRLAGRPDKIQLHRVPVLLGPGQRQPGHTGEGNRELKLASLTEAQA